jgi:hypothetical protein
MALQNGFGRVQVVGVAIVERHRGDRSLAAARAKTRSKLAQRDHLGPITQQSDVLFESLRAHAESPWVDRGIGNPVVHQHHSVRLAGTSRTPSNPARPQLEVLPSSPINHNRLAERCLVHVA